MDKASHISEKMPCRDLSAEEEDGLTVVRSSRGLRRGRGEHGEVRAAGLHLWMLEEAQVLSNEAGRFSKVYPAGPLFIPECSFTKDCTTPTSNPE